MQFLQGKPEPPRAKDAKDKARVGKGKGAVSLKPGPAVGRTRVQPIAPAAAEPVPKADVERPVRRALPRPAPPRRALSHPCARCTRGPKALGVLYFRPCLLAEHGRGTSATAVVRGPARCGAYACCPRAPPPMAVVCLHGL